MCVYTCVCAQSGLLGTRSWSGQSSCAEGSPGERGAVGEPTSQGPSWPMALGYEYISIHLHFITWAANMSPSALLSDLDAFGLP